MDKIIPFPKKDKTYRPISLLTAFSKVMEELVLARVKWAAQSINQYSLCFRSGVGTIDAIAALIHTATPINALKTGFDYVRLKTDRKMNLIKVRNSLSDVGARIMKNIYPASI